MNKIQISLLKVSLLLLLLLFFLVFVDFIGKYASDLPFHKLMSICHVLMILANWLMHTKEYDKACYFYIKIVRT